MTSLDPRVGMLCTAFEWLVAMSWQIAVVFTIVLVLDRRLARGARGQVRHALWCLVALKLIVPPQLPAWWRPPAIVTTGSVVEPSAAGGHPMVALWVCLWAFGVVIALVAGIRLRRRLHRELRDRIHQPPPWILEQARETAQRLGPRRRRGQQPRIALADVASPLVYGCRRPTIVLPDTAVSWSCHDLAHALAHEIAHVQRRDLWIQAIWSLLQAVYWFHPLVHVAARHAHGARELACDATVAARFGAARYRRSLVRLAAAAHGIAAPQGVARATAIANLLGHHDGIFSRLSALETAHRAQRRPALEMAGLIIVGACALPLARPSSPTIHHQPSSVVDARALALQTAEARRLDPSTTGSLHVRWAMLQLAAQQEASTSIAHDPGAEN